MSADRIRLAATRLREVAELATEGPWQAAPHVRRDANAVKSGETFVTHYGRLADVVYIALVSPPVGVAVAAWLEAVARAMVGTSAGDVMLERYAVDVAEAVLGESS